MKIRTGFVSNSSSSSFCILGIDVGQGTFDYDKLEEFEDAGLSTHDGYGDYGCVIGISVCNLNEEKTIRQLKEDVAEEITRITGIKTTADEVDFCTDGGYDG